MELNVLRKYVLGHLSSTAVIDDVWDVDSFSDDIVKTSHWYNEYEKQEYANKGSKHYRAEDVLYETTAAGFRSSKNIKNNTADKTIACFGCSNTFGIGLPWDETWPVVLQQRLDNSYVVKNYGLPGASNDTIARLIHNYLRFNKPDAICCYFPEISRVELFSEGKYKTFFPYDMGSIDSSLKLNKSDLRAFQQLYSVEAYIYNFVKNFKFIEALCNSYNVKFYWHTWSLFLLALKSNIITEHLNERNMINLFDNSVTSGMAKYTRYFKINKQKARDDKHIGKQMCEKIGTGFYNMIID